MAIVIPSPTSIDLGSFRTHGSTKHRLTDDLDALADQFVQFSLHRDFLQETLQRIKSGDRACQLDGAHKFRKMLQSDETSASVVSDSIEQGAVEALVKMLTGVMAEDIGTTNSRLLRESTWCLTNIAAGPSEHTQRVVEAGAIPVLLDLLHAQHEELTELALWCLANVAGDRYEYRMQLVSHPTFIRDAIKAYRRAAFPVTRRIAIWALSNLCRLSPPPELSLILPAVEFMNELLRAGAAAEICGYSLESLVAALHAEGDRHCRTSIRVDSSLVRALLSLLTDTQSSRMAVTATEALRQIAGGDSYRAGLVISAEGMQFLPPLIASDRCPKNIRLELLRLYEALLSSSVADDALDVISSTAAFRRGASLIGTCIDIACGTEEELDVRYYASAVTFLVIARGQDRHTVPLLAATDMRISSTLMSMLGLHGTFLSAGMDWGTLVEKHIAAIERLAAAGAALARDHGLPANPVTAGMVEALPPMAGEIGGLLGALGESTQRRFRRVLGHV